MVYAFQEGGEPRDPSGAVARHAPHSLQGPAGLEVPWALLSTIRHFW
jgi:hypothetical protein